MVLTVNGREKEASDLNNKINKVKIKIKDYW